MRHGSRSGDDRSNGCAARTQAMLSRLPGLTDAELTGLADAWCNTPSLARARSKALSPDLLPVVDILRAFDDLSHLYAADLDDEGEHLTVPPAVVSTALKAVRDALAGAIAAPALSRRETAALLAAWQSVMGDVRPLPPAPTEPEVERLLRAVGALAGRCHDPRAAEGFDRILLGAMTCDRDDHGRAVATAFQAALFTSRHRTWSLLRSRAERGVEAPCRWCPPGHGFDGYDRERVATLCADAACALLVADALEPPMLDRLLEPLSGLVPFPRPPLDA